MFLGRAVARYVRRLVEQGIHPGLDEALKKRIRLTNGLSLFGALLMFISIPRDILQSPRWIVFQDVIGGSTFAALPLLNRFGHLTASRIVCITIGNLIVLGDAALMGHESGIEIAFLALAAIPFAFFDLHEWRALFSCAALSVVCYVVAHSGAFGGLQLVRDGFVPSNQHGYTSMVAWAVLLFALYQTSLANSRAERALREDITRRQRAEQELEKTRQSSVVSAKMAALGEMSGNIAHEINNPLAAILLRAQALGRLAEKDQLDTAALARAAKDIESTVFRIRGIVDALRSFARDAENDPMVAGSVRQIVKDSVELCAQRFQQHAIKLVVPPISEDLFLHCRSIQISQILLNLLSNAHDAVEKGAAPWVRISVEADSVHVRIAVIDSGPGVSPELESRIMEPFFTTKDVGKGTGLGLSVSKGIAESHGGRLSYDRSSANTKFVLTLPRGTEPPTAAPVQPDKVMDA
jgi:signal transduction histidine kinase